MTKMPPFVFENPGRSRKATSVLLIVYALVAYGVLVLDMARWIAAIVLAVTLPTVWDIATNRRAWLRLNDETLDVSSGKVSQSFALRDIDYVRLDTRLDFSVKATVVDLQERKNRLPYDCVPPVTEFEDALRARGVRVERHHFALFN